MTQENTTLHCPQCGEPTERLCDGYCEPCRAANQSALDLHNTQHAAWRSMSDTQRGHAIKDAARWG